ncbi:uncharacterized protein C3orf38 homolog, partial [Chrysoperla carnea]|uniref:uncharacterized protein C3orf38 homolog n=1 Tax=Chrysoperla carnea TaxID=189513 RepID=UPI001D09138A
MDDIHQESAKQFLVTLNLDVLNSLVGTVTQYLVKEEFDEKHDAIKVIFRHSPNVKSILRRKVITKEILFKYLSEENVTLHPPHTKDSLIDSVLDYWDRRISRNNRNSGNNETPIPNNGTRNETISEEVATYEPKANNRVQKNETNVNEMAVTFSEWFYKMFNDNKPIGVEHFWNDCNFKLNLKSGETICSDTVENSAENTVKLLYDTKMTHRIYLNPNLLPEGCQGRIDNHGVVLVLACGTIHLDNSCVGVFEQVFALVRDPLICNNWKIKYTELNLRNQPNTSSTPRLTDHELTNKLLE